ncbi:endonuclease/exonuclease/phosphatase family protein [Bifidobacterium tsurumiense]|uniref:Endonuclease/exonuclease/phosphatase n=1 Tax=Bifidobacterium tsurumiense TaxID=356829 RepID=A0A087EKA9_9BIFI|nr:endonuclease/exonuclease/phosphatase family protein [Bifidobacterium tsurumiense]KFJ08210.1 endonuclease/exonuclease/phosphatase [Bifidobacterium tsurumiense]
MTALLWCIILVCAVWLGLRQLPAGADGHNPLPYLIALLPFAPFITFPALLLSLWLGDGVSIAAACVVAIWSCLQYLPHFRCHRSNGSTDSDRLHLSNAPHASDRETIRETSLASRETHRETSDGSAETHLTDASDERPETNHTLEPLRMLTINCRYGRANEQAIIDAVQQQSISVLCLEELTSALVQRLEQAGLEDLLPHRQIGTIADTDNGGFNAIWTSLPISCSQPSGIPDYPAAAVPSISIEVSPSRTVTIAAAHPKSPMRGCREWSQGIIALGSLMSPTTDPSRTSAAQSTRTVNDSPTARSTDQSVQDLVVCGDFNANLNHPSFRRLLRYGLYDAAMVLGRGAAMTYPSWLRWPRIELDHVLHTNGLTPELVETLFIEGTDHMGLHTVLHFV